MRSVFMVTAKVCLLLGSALCGAPQLVGSSVELWQAKNGAANLPTSPVEWVRGNAGPANSHYIESYSIPYRLVVSGLAEGSHRLTIEWDTRWGGRHAIDYITHYQRLEPHTVFDGHSQSESVNPLDGLVGSFAAPATFPIPPPSMTENPIPGQPFLSFDALPPMERTLTIWNGEISGAAYVLEEPLTNASASARLSIDFVSGSDPVVIAWGGHIASQYDWGLDQAATSIRGAPYHMRLVSLDGEVGNQDRSLEAGTQTIPPPCVIEGPTLLCNETGGEYRLAYPFTAPEMMFQWTVTGAEGVAEILGATDGSTLRIRPIGSGNIQLEVALSLGTNHSTCQLSVQVSPATIATSPLAGGTFCHGSELVLATEPVGLGPFTFVWSKDGAVLEGETGPTLTRSGLTQSDAGEYCVEVSDLCGTDSQCATVIVSRPPVLLCPSELVVSWWDAVPVPDTSSLEVMDGFGTVTVAHAGDIVETNGCDFVISRAYVATDECGLTSTCIQTILVQDRIPPSVVCPADIVVECVSFEGNLVTYEAEAEDNSGLEVGLNFNPPSGTVFGHGTHEVMCTATDACGNSSQCMFLVNVRDTTPPDLAPCPPNVIVSEDPPGSGGSPVSMALPAATDLCDPQPMVFSVPASGSVLPIGMTTVECVAVDADGNEARCAFTVQVVPQVIVANTTADSGPGSLRQALMDANAAPGSNMIVFQIPGEGPFVIELASPLPVVNESLSIDGTTQPGFVFTPVIEVDGGLAGADRVGLHIASGNALVRGVVLSGFDVGILLEGPGGNVIQGNYIGVDPSGIAPLGNQSHGIVVASAGNVLGGVHSGDGNVLSGNGGHGLLIDGTEATGNVIQGNWIGLDPDGQSPLGNAGHGILFQNGASNNLVGGAESGAANHIAFNGLSGVALDSSAGARNPILSNSIYENGGLGIDLGADGVTPNDTSDADEGPNQFQNHPEIESVLIESDGTKVSGTLHGRPDQAYLVEFFLNDLADPSGFGEGKTQIGNVGVTTDGNGNGPVDILLPDRITAGQYVSATATDAAGNTSEFSGGSEAMQGPLILTHPMGVEVDPGTMVTLCVEATGSPVLVYQWRLNGASIPGATNECLVIPSAQVSDGGDYTVIVANRVNAVISDSAPVVIILPQLQAGDDFIDRTFLEGLDGSAAGNTFLATRESGEPFHFGKPGRKSVWYTWQAPENGIAMFATTGSTFDTLMAVYVGDSVDALTMVAGDEDRGGFYTSGARFNAVAGTFYHIAIDGFGLAAGHYLFEWNLVITDRLLPLILEHPISQSVAAGGEATFSVIGEPGCADGHHDCRHDHHDHHDQHDGDGHPSYQWLFNGEPILGATFSILTISNVGTDQVGTYSVLVTWAEETIESQSALLQINATGSFTQPVLAMDKLLDAALESDPLLLGIAFSPPLPPGFANSVGGAGGSIVRGYTGTHVFDNLQGRTEALEPPICGKVGGASMYLPFVVGEDSEIFFSTEGSLALDGSPLDTIIALILRAPDGTLSIPFCNDDVDPGVLVSSEFTVPVQAGVTNLLLVETLNGVRGAINLYYSFIVTANLIPLGPDESGAYHFRLEGREEMNFEIQMSENLSTWTPLLQGNAPSGVYEFVDTTSSGRASRYYRARMLP